MWNGGLKQRLPLPYRVWVLLRANTRNGRYTLDMRCLSVVRDNCSCWLYMSLLEYCCVSSSHLRIAQEKSDYGRRDLNPGPELS